MGSCVNRKLTVDSLKQNNQSVSGRLLVACGLMFALGLFAVPLYNVFSGMVDPGTKKSSKHELHVVELGQVQRTVRIQLVAVNNENMPWRFMPAHPMVTVYPGQVAETYYTAYNSTDRQMVAHAIPRVLPGEAAKYLQRTNCFCFHQQRLRGKELRLMPIRIVVSDQLPRHIKTITLSYTLFDITQTADNDKLMMAANSSSKPM